MIDYQIINDLNSLQLCTFIIHITYFRLVCVNINCEFDIGSKSKLLVIVGTRLFLANKYLLIFRDQPNNSPTKKRDFHENITS